jgi:hypothetical protein
MQITEFTQFRQLFDRDKSMVHINVRWPPAMLNNPKLLEEDIARVGRPSIKSSWLRGVRFNRASDVPKLLISDILPVTN